MIARLFRTSPLLLLVGVVLGVALVAGLYADRLATGTRSPLDEARTLAGSGHYAEAEHAYITLAEQPSADVPVVLELIDNHQRLLHSLALAKDGRSPGTQARPIDEGRIDALFEGKLSPDVTVLAGYWRKLTDGEATLADRELVLEAADREPPVAWANDVLGREAQLTDLDLEAAARFAREAKAFEHRERDAALACHLWSEQGDRAELDAALGDPRFARQVGPTVRFENAVYRRDWLGALKWFFPAEYEGATRGVLILAALSALMWFWICATIGFVREAPRLRIPLYAAALVLGVASTYLTVAIDIGEERILHFSEKGNPLADAIYFVLGVGLREEGSKALMVLPLLYFVKRWGRRREALACGALVGLGFAAAENVAYFRMGLATALARFLTANFLHVSATGLMAVSMDDALRGRDDEGADVWRTLALVVAMHGLYDFFLTSPAVSGGSFLSMLVFIFLARRFLHVLRTLPGREGPLLRLFVVGLAVVVGASFVYACTLVGPQYAAMAMVQGLIGTAIVLYMFVHELSTL